MEKKDPVVKGHTRVVVAFPLEPARCTTSEAGIDRAVGRPDAGSFEPNPADRTDPGFRPDDPLETSGIMPPNMNDVHGRTDAFLFHQTKVRAVSKTSDGCREGRFNPGFRQI